MGTQENKASKNKNEEIKNLLCTIDQIVKYGKLEEFKKSMEALHGIQDKNLLLKYYQDKGIDLISLICKHNKKNLLNYILHQSSILEYLNSEISNTESKEDALYYAMYNNNFDMLEMLYDYWSCDPHYSNQGLEHSELNLKTLVILNNILESAFKRYEKHILTTKTVTVKEDISYAEQIIRQLEEEKNQKVSIIKPRKMDLKGESSIITIHKKRDIDQLMMFNIQSLLAFNEFQKDIYSQLSKLKSDQNYTNNFMVDLRHFQDESEHAFKLKTKEQQKQTRIQEAYAIKKKILTIFDCYEKYSRKADVLIKDSVIECPEKFIGYLKDDSTLLHKTSLFVIYEVYFRKLDHNICLLVLDNLHSLKLRISMAKDSYQTLENHIYSYIYHVSNKWSLYLPKRKKFNVIRFSGIYKQKHCRFLVKYNKNKYNNALFVIYLERKCFVNAMHSFKQELYNINIEKNIRLDKEKLPIEDINSLMMQSDLRDMYSLKKISHQISQLYSVDVNRCTQENVHLLIERSLQIIGEFVKTSDESLHLQKITEALLKAELSVQVVSNLKKVRSMLCHSKHGELLRRIEIEENESHIFENIHKELLFVKKKIDEIISFHKPVLKKSLITRALSLICQRLNEMPEIVAKIFFYIQGALSFNKMNKCCRFAKENELYQQYYKPLGYSEELMVEVKILGENFLKLHSELRKTFRNIHFNLARKFPVYKTALITSLNEIEKFKLNWQIITNALRERQISLDILGYPNEKDVNSIRSYLKIEKDDSIEQLIKDIESYPDFLKHWEFLENLLEFLVFYTLLDNYSLAEFETRKQWFQQFKNNYQNNDIEKEVKELLVRIEEQLDLPKMGKTEQSPEFTGINQLTYRLAKANFLTKEEKELLTNTLKQIQANYSMKQLGKIKEMMDIIKTDEAIPKRKLTNFIYLINLDEKAQNMLMNLVVGHERDPLLLQCLSKRVHLFKTIGSMSRNKLIWISLYKTNKTFRTLLELLLFDIFDILQSVSDNNKIVKKSRNLLKEINLRHFLTHGSPLLEIVGGVLDSNDLPTELISKALDFIQDERSINALIVLNDLGFNFNEIDKDTHDTEHNKLLIDLKSSLRWKDYLQLIPGIKQKSYENRKKAISTANESSIYKELLRAVNEKNASLLQETIDKGTDVNFIDRHKKAFIHYAAMRGDISVMGVLIKNGADVNVRTGDSDLTPLHYSAMNGFKDSVEFLLEKGADCFALDGRGRTAVYTAVERNHESVSLVLLRAMMRVMYQVLHILKDKI